MLFLHCQVNINELLVDAGLYSEATPTERIGDSCVDMSSQTEATSRRVFSDDDMAQLQVCRCTNGTMK